MLLLGLKILAYILAFFPEWLISSVALALSKGFVYFPSKARSMALNNIHLIYGLSPNSSFSRQFLKQNMRSQVHIFFDTLKFALRKITFQINDEEILASIIRDKLNPEKISAFFVTAHLGCWELAGSLLAKYSSRDVFVLAKPSRAKVFVDFLTWLRGSTSLKVLWTDRPSLGKQMFRAIKAGQILGFVMDQKPEKRQGINVDFLGQNTPFVSGPGALSIKYQVPVYSIFVTRTGSKSYQLVSEIIFDPEPKDPSITPETVTQICATKIASAIACYPEQWTWTYKRWENRKKSDV